MRRINWFVRLRGYIRERILVITHVEEPMFVKDVVINRDMRSTSTRFKNHLISMKN